MESNSIWVKILKAIAYILSAVVAGFGGSQIPTL